MHRRLHRSARTWLLLQLALALLAPSGVPSLGLDANASDEDVALAPLEQLTIGAPPVVAFGAPASITATLETTSGVPIPGRQVEVQYSTDGSSWTTGGMGVTDATGGFSLASPALTAQRLFRATAAAADGVHVVSKTTTVTPRAYLTAPTIPTIVNSGQTYAITGYLKPRHAAGTYPVAIRCERYEKQSDGTYGWVLRKSFPAKATDYASYTKYSASVSLPSGGKWRVRAYAPTDSGHAPTHSAVRTTLATPFKAPFFYPWAHYIVIDKSDFRLYWVTKGYVRRVYPVAHGKASTPTPSRVWRIDAKYLTNPTGVYGPRKMRLFKRVWTGSRYSYAYTAYGIHGTNEPWVIGTMASHGCIRLKNADILALFPLVPLGTMVVTRD